MLCVCFSMNAGPAHVLAEILLHLNIGEGRKGGTIWKPRNRSLWHFDFNFHLPSKAASFPLLIACRLDRESNTLYVLRRRRVAPTVPGHTLPWRRISSACDQMAHILHSQQNYLIYRQPPYLIVLSLCACACDTCCIIPDNTTYVTHIASGLLHSHKKRHRPLIAHTSPTVKYCMARYS